MRLVVKKLEVVDLGLLQSLVIEHLDSIESGLTLLDSRVLLGHATIDIVALDAEGALVLMTAGFIADEDMLLKAVEAYSWSLEYPDAIRRLYPSVEISAARPPRLMFVVERLPDAFHRKIKQLGFSEVDCVEFRHLDVSGTPAAYFDTIARLRRGSGLPEFTPAPIARRVSEPQMRRAPESMGAQRPGDKAVVDRADKVVPLVSAPSTARATSVRLQKMLNTHGSSHGNGVAPVIEIAARVAPSTPRVETPRIETPAPRVEIAAPRAEAARIEMPAPHIATPTPHIETPAPRIETPAPRIEPPRVEIATPSVEPPQVETPAPRVEPPQVETPAPRVEPPPAEPPAPRVEAPRAETALPPLELLRAELAAAAVVAPAPRTEIPAPRVKTPAAVVELTPRLTLRESMAIPVPTPAAAAAPQAPEPRVSFAEIAKELLGTSAPAPRLDAPAVIPRPPVEEITRATLEALAAAAADAVSETDSAVAIEDVPADLEIQEAVAALVKETAAPPVAPPVIKKPVVEDKAKSVVEDKAKPMIAAAPRSAFAAAGPKAAPAAPKPAIAATLGKPAPVAPAAKATMAAPASAPAATPAVKPAAAEPAAPSLPQEFEGLKFPNDGVLTRQWMEFLNQMASSK
jgi:hypothetical protein